jgi:hypothetical protein
MKYEKVKLWQAKIGVNNTDKDAMQLYDLIGGLLVQSKKSENCMKIDKVYDFERNVDQ